MNANARYVLAGFIGVVIGALAIFWRTLGLSPHQLSSTCPVVRPGSSAGNAYGFYLADTGSGSQATGSNYFYNPGGYRHNVAMLYLPSSNNISNSPVIYDLGANCVDGGSGPAATATMSLIDQHGNQVSTLVFNQMPSSGSNATFGLTLSQYNSSDFPPTTMTGDAYLMQ